MPETQPPPLRSTLAHAHWHPCGLLHRLDPPRHVRPWLRYRGSLTQVLRAECPSLRVQVLSEGYQRANPQEALALGIAPTRLCWVRTIVMHCRQQPWVYARTVIPNLGPGNPWYSLKQLGNQPLGEVLFNTPGLTRSDFHVSRLHGWQPNLFARQSVFQPSTLTPLLLTEVLTDALP